MDVREFVEKLRKDRNLSLNELCSVLGYHSKTSMVRLLKGESDVRSFESFVKRAKNNMDLTSEEKSSLATLLKYIRSGDGRSVYEMECFLAMGDQTKNEIELNFGDGKSEKLSKHYRTTHNLQIILLNCQYTQLFSELKRLIVEQNAVVEHYMLENDDAACIIHVMSALLPVVHEKNYAGYVIADTHQASVLGMQGAEAMIVSYQNENGRDSEELIIFNQPNHGNVVVAQTPGEFRRMLRFPWNGYRAIKQTYFQCTMMDNYVQYSMDYAELERDCAQYIIKPDPCIDLIPTKVLKAAFVDKCGKVDETLLCNLVGIYEKRFQNIVQKRKPTHYVMKRRAMWYFIHTGETLDHFWGMRPYTLAERLRVIEHLVEQVQDNPYFNIYFLQDDDMLVDIQIGYYEGKGMLILDSKTSFNLAEGHSEVLITQKRFLQLFKDYYLKQLIRDCVISYQETVCFLKELAEYCRSQLGAPQ